jgi:hypothetical protein
MADEHAKKLELGGSQMDLVPIATNNVRCEVYLQAPTGDHALLGLWRDSAEHGFQPGE